MRGSRHCADWRVALCACAAVVVLMPRARSAQTIDESFRAGRYHEAFEALEGIEDLSLRDEWRFQVLYAAGDLPGALAAVRAGLERAPQHLGLLQNGINCALSLGLGGLAQRWCAQWRIALEAASLTPDARAAQLASVERYEQFVAPLAESEETMHSARRRALIVSLGLLSATVGSFLWLARRRTR